MKKVLGILTIGAFALLVVGAPAAQAVGCSITNVWGDDGVFSCVASRTASFTVGVSNFAAINITTNNVANSGGNIETANQDLLGSIETGDADATTTVTVEANSTVVALDNSGFDCDCEPEGLIDNADSDDGVLSVDVSEDQTDDIQLNNFADDYELHNQVANTGDNLQAALEDNGDKMTPSEIKTGDPTATLTKSLLLNFSQITRGLLSL